MPPARSSTAAWVAALLLTTSSISVGEGASASVQPRQLSSAASLGSGPALHTPRARLARAVACTARVTRSNPGRTVLLVHGTGSTPSETWGWNYRLALAAEGFGVCTVRLPDRGRASLTLAAEYVVFAARQAIRRSGRPIAMVGHSQGGFLAVWATQFWPDVARGTADVVSIAGPMQGTGFASILCAVRQCIPLAWQLRRDSRHVAALNRAALSRTTAYTSIATRYDEIVFPQPEASRLPGATNLLTQDVCPTDPVEHGLILGDPVAYAVTLDALRRRRAARPDLLPTSLCTQTFIPHGDLAGSAQFVRSPLSLVLGAVDPRRWVPREPGLPAYAR